MIRFWLDSREYTAPDAWLARRITALRIMGATANEAAIEAMRSWAEQAKEAV